MKKKIVALIMLRAMKRIKWIASILCIVMLFITACASEETVVQNEEPDPELDFQMQYYDLNIPTHPIVEVEDGYYIIVGYYIYYVDKETMEYTPLCNKANCLHQKETDQTKVLNCNAMVRTNPAGYTVLNYYKKNLYIAGNELVIKDGFPERKFAMIKLPLNGGNREIVYEFEEPISIAIVHRGYIYYATSSMEGADISKLCRVPVDGGEAEVLYTAKDRDKSLDFLQIVNNAVIVREMGSLGDSITYYKYDLGKEEVEEVLLDGDTKVGRIDVVNDRIYYPVSDEEKDYSEWEMESMNLDGSDRRKENIKYYNVDDDYYYEDDFENEKQIVYEWETNDKVTEFSKPIDGAFYLGKEKVFWYAHNDRGGYTVTYTDRKDIPKGKSAVKVLMDVSKEESTPGIVIP